MMVSPPYFILLKSGRMIRLLGSTSVCLLGHHFMLLDDVLELSGPKCFRVDQVVQIHTSNVSLKVLE